jgi:hypothetical protein
VALSRTHSKGTVSCNLGRKRNEMMRKGHNPERDDNRCGLLAAFYTE